MANIKVLQLERWMLNEQEYSNEPLLGSYRYPEIAPIVGRNGQFMRAGECWLEINGKAYKNDAKMFRHDMKTLDAERLNVHQIAALKAVVAQGMATKQQKDMLFYVRCANELRRIDRHYNRLRLRFKRR